MRLTHGRRDPPTHLQGVGERAMCHGVLGEGVDPGGSNVREDGAVHCQRAGLGFWPVPLARHVGPGEGIERYGVARGLRESEEREGVEEALTPPEVLGQEEARHPFPRTASEGEVERWSEPQ